MRLVYADENIRAVYRPADSPLLLVTFSPAAFPAQNPGFWGGQFAEALGCAALGFVGATINWFPARSMQAAARAAMPVLADFAEVVTFGFSLGGYGALKCGRLLRADFTIAFSPQSPAVRAATPFTLESKNPELLHGFDAGPDDVAPRAFLIYDPLNAIDSRSVRAAVDAETDCVPVPTYGSGHVSIRPCVSVLAELFEACRDDDRKTLFAVLARGRREFRRRPVTLAGLAAERRPALAERLHRHFADRFTPVEAAELQAALSRGWARAGEPEAARRALRRAQDASLLAAAAAAEDRHFRRVAKLRSALATLPQIGGWPHAWTEADSPAADLLDQPLAV